MTGLNPYHAWLGLPAEIDRPNFYQLLQLAPADCSREAVIAAAKSALKRLKPLVANPEYRSRLAELAKEVEAAAQCLASKSAREQYNQQLLSAIASPTAGEVKSVKVDAAIPVKFEAAAIPVATPVVDDQTPMAIPVEPPVDSPTLQPPEPTSPDAPPRVSRDTFGAVQSEPKIVVGQADLFRRRRRSSIPLTAYIGTVLAILLLVGAGILVARPDILQRLRYGPKIASAADATHQPSDESNDDGPAEKSPLDIVAAGNSSPSNNHASDHLVVPTKDDAAMSPSNRAQPELGNSQATPDVDSANASSASKPNENAASASPDPTNPSPDPPLQPQPIGTMSDAAVDFYLSSTLSSLVKGNNENAIELFSRLEPTGIDEAVRDRFEQVAQIADIHFRYSQLVRMAAEQVIGGENIQIGSDQTIGIVEANPDLVVYRVEGENIRLPYELLPATVGLALAKRAGATDADVGLFAAVEIVLEAFGQPGNLRDPASLQSLELRVKNLPHADANPAKFESLIRFIQTSLIPLANRQPIPADPNSAEVDRALASAAKDFDSVAEADRAIVAIEAGFSQTDAVRQIACFRYAKQRALENGDVALGLAVVDALAEESARSGSLLAASVQLGGATRLTDVDARSIVRTILFQLRHSGVAGSTDLAQTCSDLITRFKLEGYRSLLQKLSGQK